MINIISMTIKNFMSVGEITQVMEFTGRSTALILGENLDMVAENACKSRNGAGKTTITAALSYALYGQTISSIKRDNLINNINERNMLVTLKFTDGKHEYEIQRGRKPAVFKFFIDKKELAVADQSQGESADTQQHITSVLGMSHNLFKNLIVLNTTTEPFLRMSAKQQREFIEELLGMKILSDKAEALREVIKQTRQSVTMEEFRIKTIAASNDNITKSIADLRIKSENWVKTRQRSLDELAASLEALSRIDIDQELAMIASNQAAAEHAAQHASLQREHAQSNRSLASLAHAVQQAQTQLVKLQARTCPTCDQTLLAHNHETIQQQHEQALALLQQKHAHAEKLHEEISQKLQESSEISVQAQTCVYATAAQAYQHVANLQLINQEIAQHIASQDPYQEQIDTLTATALQPIDDADLQALHALREHQDFLLKLLTHSDSFLRKNIIDHSLAHLNARLQEYLQHLCLPHHVRFLNDLTVKITNFGKDMDFDNLSRGESTRLILALSWAFRDIFEYMNHEFNVMIIDELLDNGTDQQLTERAFHVLRSKQNANKNIFIISHKDYLMEKASDVLMVIKEAGFSTLAWA